MLTSHVGDDGSVTIIAGYLSTGNDTGSNIKLKSDGSPYGNESGKRDNDYDEDDNMWYSLVAIILAILAMTIFISYCITQLLASIWLNPIKL